MAREPGTRDYRSGTRKDPEGKSAPIPPSDGQTSNQVGTRWWEATGKECADRVATRVKFLQGRQDARLRNMVKNARLYGNVGSLGLGSSAFGNLLQSPPATKKYATYNATQSGVDTLVSHIGETKPRPYYLTSGGNYRQQRQAKKLTQFNDGVFYETKAYRKGPLVFRDAAVWGDGFEHVFARGGKMHMERVISAELWVDEVEAQYGFPRNLDRVKDIDRDELAGYFPEKKHKDAIMKATAAKVAGSASDTISSMVTVAESWHLGSLGADGELHGGKRSMTLFGSNGHMLVEPEEWEFDFFPFARLPWCAPLIGFWSQGGVEQVSGEQMWLNELFWTVQKAMRLGGTLKVAMEHGSKLVDEHINNEIGAVLKHAPGKPPVFFTAAPVDPSFFMEMREGVERIYKKLGVSELSASNMKPAGLDSKPALREYKDTQNERHKTTAEAYDDFYLQLGHMARCLARGIKGYKVRVPGASGFRVIDYDDLKEAKDESIVLQMFPISSLPRDPAGRTQTIQEWVQAGWLTPRQGRKLMDFPDLQSANTLADAQEELITETLDRIVDDGDYRPPEPTDDLALCKESVLHYIQLYRRLELEPAKLDKLRQWNQQVDMLTKRMLAPLAAAPPAPGAQPGATPQGTAPPAPQADLMPQAA
jgi:hypothetical protein